MSINSPVRIFLVEDHEVFRMGLKELINHTQDLSVCGESSDAKEAWKMIRGLNPDIAIVDISLKDSDGIDLIKDIHKVYKNLPTLVLSTHDESVFADRALAAGARGYVMKQETSDTIIKAIRHVLQGNVYVSEKVMSKILNRFTGHKETLDRSPENNLTDRELAVFQLIGEGSSTREIANRLCISMKTVSTYRERIKEKLILTNASELVRFAMHWCDKVRK